MFTVKEMNVARGGNQSNKEFIIVRIRKRRDRKLEDQVKNKDDSDFDDSSSDSDESSDSPEKQEFTELFDTLVKNKNYWKGKAGIWA